MTNEIQYSVWGCVAGLCTMVFITLKGFFTWSVVLCDLPTFDVFTSYLMDSVNRPVVDSGVCKYCQLWMEGKASDLGLCYLGLFKVTLVLTRKIRLLMYIAGMHNIDCSAKPSLMLLFK